MQVIGSRTTAAGTGRSEAGSGAPSDGRRPGTADEDPWGSVRDRLHDRGLRWTPQRRTLIEVLATAGGHVSATELVERCREIDPETTPSTVYRTLDVLESLGLVRHHHGADGREEFHVLPTADHGHLRCRACGGTWEIDEPDAEALIASLEAGRGFAVDLSHLSIVGLCSACREDAEA